MEKTDQIAGKLLAYLRDELNDSTTVYTSPPSQLRGGFQTATYQFQVTGLQKRLNRRLVLRLYPEYSDPENAIWESTVQNTLVDKGFPVANAHFVCTERSILGGAFFIMDFLPGKPMITAPIDTIPHLLGKTHAALHGIDPESIIKSLGESEVADSKYRLSGLLNRLKEEARDLPWIRAGVDWLIQNRPPEPERLAVCHGDFHPLNILINAGNVSGVLDWPNFLLGDPAFDVANTIVLTLSFRHLASSSELLCRNR